MMSITRIVIRLIARDQNLFFPEIRTTTDVILMKARSQCVPICHHNESFQILYLNFQASTERQQ